MIRGHYALWLIACLRVSNAAGIPLGSTPSGRPLTLGLLDIDVTHSNLKLSWQSAGTKEGWKASFEAALQHAEKRDTEFGKLVLMATVQEQMAKQHLPILLASLHQAAGLGKHLLVVALDEPAYKVCQKVGTLHSQVGLFVWNKAQDRMSCAGARQQAVLAAGGREHNQWEACERNH